MNIKNYKNNFDKNKFKIKHLLFYEYSNHFSFRKFKINII